MCGHYTGKPLDRNLVDAEWTRYGAPFGPVPITRQLRDYATGVVRLYVLGPLQARRVFAVRAAYGPPPVSGPRRPVRP
jgi:hypothetical protein